MCSHSRYFLLSSLFVFSICFASFSSFSLLIWLAYWFMSTCFFSVCFSVISFILFSSFLFTASSISFISSLVSQGSSSSCSGFIAVVLMLSFVSFSLWSFAITRLSFNVFRILYIFGSLASVLVCSLTFRISMASPNLQCLHSLS